MHGPNKYKGFDVEISSPNTPPRELCRIILSELNNNAEMVPKIPSSKLPLHASHVALPT